MDGKNYMITKSNKKINIIQQKLLKKTQQCKTAEFY